MTSNRIQKLLFSEYSDFEDIVLVEGPFAETDRQGKGIRQVQIGLTPTKLILASYFVEPVAVEELGDQWRPRRGQDPDIESFELVSAYPVECVNLSVYRHRRRQTLKARFCNGKVVYYEIGGWQERKMLWSVWCERIKFLSPYESGTSISETSVGSSSSGGSLYIVHSSLSVTQTGRPTLWCHYACTENSYQGSWIDPHLYLGPKFYDKGINCSSFPDMARRPPRVSKASGKKLRARLSQETLILSTDHEVLAEEAVEAWEAYRIPGRRVRRRYAFSPCPYLLGGLGLWWFSKPQAFSLQTKKNVSLVDLREDDEEVLPLIPKGRLVRTVSLVSLVVPSVSPEKVLDQSSCPSKVEQFWSRYPEDLLEWRCDQYKSQQRLLKTFRKLSEPRIFGVRGKKRHNKRYRRSKTEQTPWTRHKRFPVNDGDCHVGGGDSCVAPSPFDTLHHNVKDAGEEGWLLPVSTFISSSLAHQLTALHQHLFLQISTLELGRVRADMCSWRAPRLRALVFFCHRISCVVANQILLEHEVQRRAQVILKLIGVAYKCHKLNNQLSAEAVLKGLHSPPVYRLQRTWTYVRKHYASKYRRFEDLSRRYCDCQQPLYQKTYDDMVRTPPFLPSVSLLASVLLGKLPDLTQVQSCRFTTECSGSCLSQNRSLPKTDSTATVPRTLRRFLSSLHLYTRPATPPGVSACQSDSHLHSASRDTILENLDRFFSPVSNVPDRRILQDVNYFLESHQAAASRYQIPVNPPTRAFLLYSRHPDMGTLFRQSSLLEP